MIVSKLWCKAASIDQESVYNTVCRRRFVLYVWEQTHNDLKPKKIIEKKNR
jgi:hypothetical protein